MACHISRFVSRSGFSGVRSVHQKHSAFQHEHGEGKTAPSPIGKPGGHMGCFPLHGKMAWRFAYIAIIILSLTLVGVLVWLSLVVTVLGRLKMSTSSSGLNRIVQEWKTPEDSLSMVQRWPEDFSRGIRPIRCHSHNDYTRRVPLFEALAAGCVGIEADIWFENRTDGSADLLVGHEKDTLDQSRTLSSLYTAPILSILRHQNQVPQNSSRQGNTGALRMLADNRGVFSDSPNTSIILLLDFKTEGTRMWEMVMQQLQMLREGSWLTSWTNTTGVIRRPVTVVATGNAPFDLITSNSSYRDIFFDAPLDRLDGPSFNGNNSLYASVSFPAAVGKTYWGRLSQAQSSKVVNQVQHAADRGLIARYWDTPSWPIGWRNRIWDSLVGLGTGILNVDDLSAASRWDWNMCLIGGLILCG